MGLTAVYKYLFVSFLCWLVFVGFNFAFEIKLGDALDKFYDNYQTNSKLDSLNWKAVVWDLYKKSLDLVKNNQMIPMFDAINKTVAQLNSDENCQLDSQDIINILYFTNDWFKRDLKNNLVWFVKPQKDDMANSCNKWNVCKYDPVWWKLQNTVTLNNNCQSLVEKQFVQFYLNSYYIQNIQWWNEWSNFFWNFSLEDSNYDIMSDVYALSTILFDWNVKPQETRFYKMPSVNYQSIVNDSDVSMQIDWFSPYNTYIVNTWSSDNETWSTGWNSNWTWNNTDDNINEGNDDLDINQDIWELIDVINTTINIDWQSESIVWWNQCVSGTIIEWYDWYNLSWWNNIISGENLLDPWEYLDDVLTEIEELSCNADNICQSWETPDCIDCIAEWTWNTTFEEIEQLLNDAQQSWSGAGVDDQTLGCFQSCQQVPCNAMSCDKIVCYAKCACQVYESPVFDPSITPWLTSVFKIKFCIVPVLENQTTKNKMVYNIASIFTEIYNVLQNLRNSGELAVSVKTKEFLDTSYKKNNFGEQLSFTLNSTTKPSVATISEAAMKEEQINTNILWMENILWFSKEAGLNTEKNKYVIMDDPCEYVVSKQITKDQDQRAQLLEQCHDVTQMNLIMPDVEDALKDQKTVLIDSEFESFLKLNSDFWYEMSDMLSVWNSSAQVLSKK